MSWIDDIVNFIIWIREATAWIVSGMSDILSFIVSLKDLAAALINMIKGVFGIP